MKQADEKKPRFLIIRPDRIGDVVLSTPFPREIKSAFPDSFVAVMVRPYTEDIFLNNPHVDDIILYDDTDNLYFGLTKTLRAYNFDYAFMLLPKEELNWVLFFSGIKHRIGGGHKFYQFMSNTKSVFRNNYDPLRHEADYCLDMLRKIGIYPSSLEPEIHLSEQEKAKAESNKKNLQDTELKVVGINTTSGNSAPNWCVNDYKILIEYLLKIPQIKVVVTDVDVPEELKNIEGVIYFNEDNSLRESIINFSTLDLLISASTGPMHIAAALKVKTLSLFTRETACSPLLWGPLGNEAQILLPEESADMKYCFPNPKNYHFDGEGGITPERVLTKTVEMLNIS